MLLRLGSSYWRWIRLLMANRETSMFNGRNMGKKAHQVVIDAEVADYEFVWLGAGDSRFIEHVARCEDIDFAKSLCVPESVLHG